MEIKKYESQESNSEDIIAKLIMDTYLALFEENKSEKKPDGRIPSVRQIFNKADWDFDTGCFDVIYGIDKRELTEENIMLLLERKQCVYRWGAFVCGDAQIQMFNEEELIGDNEGWYIDAPNR